MAERGGVKSMRVQVSDGLACKSSPFSLLIPSPRPGVAWKTALGRREYVHERWIAYYVQRQAPPSMKDCYFEHILLNIYAFGL